MLCYLRTGRRHLSLDELKRLQKGISAVRVFEVIREKPTTVAIVLLTLGLADFVIIWLLVANRH